MRFQNMVDIRNINKHIIAPAFENAKLYDISSQINGCGDFSKVYECLDCHTQEYKSVATCHNKFCLMCNTIKSRHWLGRLYEHLEKFLFDGKYIVMLTFTIRDTDTLKEGVDILNRAWRNFTNTIKGCRADFRNRWLGGIKSLEVKTGAGSGKWHPHIHCLMVKDSYSYDEIYLNGTSDNGYKSAWRYCVEMAGGGLDNGHVHVESIYCKNEFGRKVIYSHRHINKDSKTNVSALAKAIIESVKYISKFDYSKESSDRLHELVEGVYRVRQIDCYGVLKDLVSVVEKDMDDDNDHGTVEHVCKMCGYTEARIIDMLTDKIIDNKTDKFIIKDDFQIGEPISDELKFNVKVYNGVVQPEVISIAPIQGTLFE